MKTLSHLKRTIFGATLFASLIFALSSCGETKNAESEEDSKEVAEEKNEETFDTRASEKDAQFLVNAAETGMMEVKLAQLALTKSKNADVKELATMMETEHTKANLALNELAGKKNISIPTALTTDGEDAYKKLSDLDGAKFDKEYCEMMVKGHSDVVDRFEKASNDATDMDIKNWASTMLPTLRAHLEYSKTCKDKTDKI